MSEEEFKIAFRKELKRRIYAGLYRDNYITYEVYNKVKDKIK